MSTIASMEPMLPDERQDLEDLATELVSKASGLAGRLHPVLRASVGDLVRSMNCYYSNLIEGHNTLPIDIDRALKDDYAGDSKRRNLQLEARAHIEVQRMIDRGSWNIPDLLAWIFTRSGSRSRWRRADALVRWKYLGEVANDPGAISKLSDRLGRPGR